MDIGRFLATRRDGGVHSASELASFTQAVAEGALPDYQVSAWLMAAFLNPLSPEETAALTLGMADSGERLDLSALPAPRVDKHSTGGVGDKTTLVLLPLLAACGLTVVKMSGRGLGITGGTVDKLGAVPGFRTDLTPAEMISQAGRIGLALTGQTPNLAPADKVLYALRDATGTVASVPLIVSSILSKKLAGGADTVVLDVKCGEGGFMPTLADARVLAEALQAVGERVGLNLRLAITDMNDVLGFTAGNANEVAEAMAILRGTGGSPRFRALCVELARLTLRAVGRDADPEAALADGRAWEKARVWFEAQGADAAAVSADLAPAATHRQEVRAERSGCVAAVRARPVGEAALILGAGRVRKEDAVDPGAGVTLRVEAGAEVRAGDVLAVIGSKAERLPEALELVRKAVQITNEAVAPRPVVLETRGE